MIIQIPLQYCKIFDHVSILYNLGYNLKIVQDSGGLTILNPSELNIFSINKKPLGKGVKLGENAASITYGKEGVLHAFKCLMLQDENGNVANAYSVASGLDYPGVGPKHCYLHEIGRVNYDVITDREAIDAFYELSKAEGIIPALESSHAVAYALKLAQKFPKEKILVNLSGRGDKDIEFVLKNIK